MKRFGIINIAHKEKIIKQAAVESYQKLLY